jgi:hypothetical protein
VSILSPFQRERNKLLSFYVKSFFVTPYGFTEVTLTSPVDMPGCIIDTLEPVSKMRRLAIPSISTEIVDASNSNRIETKNILTALSVVVRWKELSSFAPLTSFHDS